MRALTCGSYRAVVEEELPPLLIRRIRDIHWIGLDCAAAALLLIVSVGHAAGQRPDFGLVTWIAVAASAVTAVAVAARRVRPLAVFAVVLALNTMVTAIGASGNPAAAVAFSLYTVAVSQPPRRSLAALAGALVLTMGAEAYSGLARRPALPWQTLQDLLAASALIIAAAWAIGAAAREQRRYAARAAGQLAERAVADERLRIARELHDVIAHSMTLITAKAAVTNYLIDTRPEEARSALGVIEATGRTALVEMRHMLGVLRADGNSRACPDVDTRAPAPGLAGLEALAVQATAAGVRTDLQIRGERELPEAMALTVYRIVQEALTNIIKHAGPANCRVLVDLTGDHVDIDVSDDGRVPPPTTGGHGLIGMRERVSLYNGHFTAGPRPEGGYRVTVQIPIGTLAATTVTGEQRPT
jgi:signal transduction histidine kinase